LRPPQPFESENQQGGEGEKDYGQAYVEQVHGCLDAGKVRVERYACGRKERINF